MFVFVGHVSQVANIIISFDHSLEYAVWLLAISSPFNFVTHIVTGIADYRIGPKVTSIVGVAIAIVGFVTMNLFAAASPVACGISTILFLVGVTVLVSECPSMTTYAFGRRDFLNVWPVVSTIYQLLQNIGIVIVALIAAAIGYKFDLWIMCVVLVVVIIIMLTVPSKEFSVIILGETDDDEVDEKDASDAV
jgi:hypothetical protein